MHTSHKNAQSHQDSTGDNAGELGTADGGLTGMPDPVRKVEKSLEKLLQFLWNSE